ncbi:UDP-3-O-acyl-N-acetylglucosamine deacetylase, partial [Porphyromonas cangingivalis]|uniref:UDP-3-O-acyl-N-acetylglucosamine deacetylase n=1 Tax=Porphyromonas cangingivalis TaxID=36874 RepID=UPI0024326CF0
MDKQQTLASAFELTGKGLHTGLEIHIKFSPAPENHGIKIRRVDLPDNPTIPALAEHVSKTDRGTVLSNQSLQVSTVEHAMAALYAMGVDNCLIEVDAPEFPILDGSSVEYVKKIREVGVVEQDFVRDVYIVKKKIEVTNPNTGSSLLLLPDDHFALNVLISFDSPILSNQYATLEDIKD